MRFACNTKELSKACQSVSRAAATRASTPALECIKVSVADGRVGLCSYNLQFGISTVLPAAGAEEDGAILINAKTLCSIVKKLPSVSTTVDFNGNAVTITSGDAQFQISGIPAIEFPNLPDVGDVIPVQIPKSKLKDMLHQTLFSINEANVVRPIYTGAQLKLSSGLLQVAGTDGYRLAICKEAIDYSGGPVDCVVPKAALMEIERLLSDSEDDAITLSIGARHAVFTVEGYQVFTRLLDGEFMDAGRMIPQNYTTSVKVDAKALADSVERVSVVVNGRFRTPVACNFKHNGGTIHLQCATQLGKAEDTVHTADFQGGDVEIGFNPQYLADALLHSDCDEVQLQLTDPLRPLVVRPDDGDSFAFLVLPVRLKAGNAA